MAADTRHLTLHLIQVLGHDSFIQLAQEFGGTRLYVPSTVIEGSEIVEAIGMDGAKRLSEVLSPDTIRVPLARRERALHYRAQGLSISRIARKLGITETGVSKLFARQKNLATLRAAPAAQIQASRSGLLSRS